MGSKRKRNKHIAIIIRFGYVFWIRLKCSLRNLNRFWDMFWELKCVLGFLPISLFVLLFYRGNLTLSVSSARITVYPRNYIVVTKGIMCSSGKDLSFTAMFAFHQRGEISKMNC